MISIEEEHNKQREDKKQGEDHSKLPINMKKMMKAMIDMETSINYQKAQLHIMDKEFSKFKKFANSFIDFSKKQLEKKPRQPSGFQLPVPLSNNLCDFLEIEHHSKMPRTEVTKRLIDYISEHQLINPEKKTQIIPDEKLSKLLGKDIDLSSLTRFTIQKYMNCHYLSNKNNQHIV
jgi:chromatin remodeling complex protein RSC6